MFRVDYFVRVLAYLFCQILDAWGEIRGIILKQKWTTQQKKKAVDIF